MLNVLKIYFKNMFLKYIMTKEIIIKKGWNMISYPIEISVSELNIKSNGEIINHAWFWYPDNNETPKYDTSLIYNDTVPLNKREYIEKIYKDSKSPFPNGRYYKVETLIPGLGYLLLNRGDDTKLTVPNFFGNNKLGGNTIKIFKGWNLISVPINNISFNHPEIDELVKLWHWEQSTNNDNVKLLYNNTNSLYQEIEKCSNEDCFYPSGAQYKVDKMMTGFGYLFNNTTNRNLTWTVPMSALESGELYELESGFGNYNIPGITGAIESSLCMQITNGLEVIDVVVKSTNQGSLHTPTYTNSKTTTNEDFNIYLDNVNQSGADLIIKSNNAIFNGWKLSALYFLIKNETGLHVSKNDVTVTWNNLSPYYYILANGANYEHLCVINAGAISVPPITLSFDNSSIIKLGSIVFS